MFLHIGNNMVLNENDVIAIYNIEAMEHTVEYRQLIEYLKKTHRLTVETDTKQKTLVITKEKEKIMGYMSNISSITIARRAQMNIKNRIDKL